MAKQSKGGPQKAGAKTGTTSGSSRSSQTATQSTKPASASKASGKTAPASTTADGAGLNRQARKEEARRQREAIRRKMARQRIMRRVLIIGAAVLVLALIVFLFVRPSGLSAQEQQLLEDAPAAAQAAGCGSIETVGPYNPSNLDRTHIGTDTAVPTNPDLSTYPSQPPASGPHAGTPMPAGVYPTPPDVYRTIHSLEHGAVIIWYAPSAASDPELAKIQDFFRESGEQDHVLVAPYNYPDQGEAGQLPQGKSMLVVAWHHTQACDQLSLPVAFAFAHDYKTPSSLTGSVPNNYKGDAPEPGLSI
jgi:hypothetical protein